MLLQDNYTFSILDLLQSFSEGGAVFNLETSLVGLQSFVVTTESMKSSTLTGETFRPGWVYRNTLVV